LTLIGERLSVGGSRKDSLINLGESILGSPKKREDKHKHKKSKKDKKEQQLAKSEIVSLSSQNAEEKAHKKDKKEKKSKSLMGSLPSNDVSVAIKGV
jgi:FKBP-type peptidyl-prolyl cis-trans isomerase